MKIITTRAEIVLEDESGYKFTIYAEERPLRASGFPEYELPSGWKGQVSLGHHHSGAAHMEGVLRMLLTEAKQLVRMLEREVAEEDR